MTYDSLMHIVQDGSDHVRLIQANTPEMNRLAAKVSLMSQEKLQANRDYADRMAFGRKCLMNVASGAKFSSDRTIRQYAEEIWHIEPTKY